jgi:hypothetical protein
MHLVFNLFLLIVISLPVYGLGTKFLFLPSSVEQLAIGNHSTLPGMFPVNPALFSAEKNQSNLMLNRGSWLGDISLMHIGFNQSFNNKIVHFGVKYSGLTDFEYRENTPQDDPLSYFSSYGISFNTGFSFSNEKYKFGFMLSHIRLGLYTEETSGFSISLGSTYNLNNGFKIGLSLENLGRMDNLITEKVKLPQRLISTISKELQLNSYQNTVFGSIDWDKKPTDIQYIIGNQLKWTFLDFYTSFLYSDSFYESSIGFSIKAKTLKIGYGIRFGTQDLGNPHMISLNILLP